MLFRSLLDALGIIELYDALDLTHRLGEYTLSPELTDYETIARDELNVILCDKELETLLPCIDLYQYGRALQDKYRLVLTEYGGIERKDCQPLMAPQEQTQPDMDGMEMM